MLGIGSIPVEPILALRAIFVLVLLPPLEKGRIIFCLQF